MFRRNTVTFKRSHYNYGQCETAFLEEAKCVCDAHQLFKRKRFPTLKTAIILAQGMVKFSTSDLL